MDSVSYEVRFDGTAYQIVRTKVYVLSEPAVATYGPFTSRALAEAEVRFHESLDADIVRNRQDRL